MYLLDRYLKNKGHLLFQCAKIKLKIKKLQDLINFISEFLTVIDIKKPSVQMAFD